MVLPIREAIIVSEPGDPLKPVGGLPLLVRTILCLQREGIERCTLVGLAPPPADARIRCELVTAPALLPAADDDLRVIVGSGAVLDRALVRELQERALPGQAIEVHAPGARVRVAPGTQVQGGFGMRFLPQRGTLRSADTPPHVLHQTLLRGLENPRDGYLDRLIYRRLSRPLTARLLATRLTPNQVTLLGIIIGMLGGWLISAASTTGVIAGVLLLLVSGVLDCSDGELARLKFGESSLGHVLDITGDTLVHLALLGGLAYRLAGTAAAPSRGVLGLLLLGVLGAFAVITASEQSEARRRRVAGWENRVLDGVLSPLTTRDWHVLIVPFALLGHLDWLVPAAAVGAQAFWLCGLWLLRRALQRASTIPA